MQAIGSRPAAYAAFGVPDDDQFGAGFLEHRRAHRTGERAFTFPEAVLARGRDARIAERVGHAVHGSERRRDDEFDVGQVLRQRAELLGIGHGIRDALEHLPIARYQWCAHA